MATTDEQWWEAQAGEYALGTLRGTERDVFEKIMSSDEAVQSRVEWWQQTLSQLDGRIEPVDPPDHLLPMIMSRIGEENVWERTVDAELEEIDQSVTPETSDSSVVAFAPVSRRRLRVWQSVAGLATAASIALAVVLVQVISRQAPLLDGDSLQRQIVSVLQSDSDQQNMWLISVNETSGEVEVQALAPPLIDQDRAFELWVALPDDAGVSSVGFVPTAAGESVRLRLPISPSDATLFAVSVEPDTGSPEAGPTGPVLGHGTVHNVTTTGL